VETFPLSLTVKKLFSISGQAAKSSLEAKVHGFLDHSTFKMSCNINITPKRHFLAADIVVQAIMRDSLTRRSAWAGA
jgi:hypothetical protein